MRKLAVAMALASTALASPALARDNSWYVGVGAGAMLVEDLDLDIGTVNNAGSLDHRAGYDAEGTVGYDFGGFRAEVEVGYREADIKSGRFTTPGIPNSANGAGTFTGSTRLNGDSNALSFMVNGLLDFGDDDGLQGFVGGGAGVAGGAGRHSAARRQRAVVLAPVIFLPSRLVSVLAEVTRRDAVMLTRHHAAEA